DKASTSKLDVFINAAQSFHRWQTFRNRRRDVEAQHEHEDDDLDLETWRQRSKEARESYHLSAGKAAELQWELGPEFLVVFEQICQQDGLLVRSIPWDPARMVGWKIKASPVRLDSRDLQIAAQEWAPTPDGAAHASVIADGSYFADYVHHIAISKPG